MSEVWNPSYSMETLDELIDDDFIISTDGKYINGKQDFKFWLQTLQTKVNNLKFDPLEYIVSDDGTRVISRMHASGRNNGIFGTEPDGDQIEFVIISIIEVKNGKLVHDWVERSAIVEIYCCN